MFAAWLGEAGRGKAGRGEAGQGEARRGTARIKLKYEVRKMEYKTTGKITEERIAEVLRIKEKNGLTAWNLLNEARKKRNPLHDLFDWDDTIAAKKWRLQQARVFINEIMVVVDSEEYYAFENVKIVVDKTEPDNSTRAYMTRDDILGHEELRQQVLDAAHEQLLYWREKYTQYNFVELRNVMTEIDKIAPREKMARAVVM